MRKTEGDISDVSITLGTIKNFQKQRQLSRGTEQFPQNNSLRVSAEATPINILGSRDIKE